MCIARGVDAAGRFTIPARVRENFNIGRDALVEIFTEKGALIIKKYEPGCVFCDAASGLLEYRGKLACISCVSAIRECFWLTKGSER
jgi:transcriptional pleiotropic regulator of transition state genes